MLLITSLPDPEDRSINFDAPCPLVGWPNMITRDRVSDIYFPAHQGTLSIKCAFHGQDNYEVGAQRYAVDDSSYLILNEGQRYASYIRSPHEVETFCVFFQAGLAADVLGALVKPADHLLSAPPGDRSQPVEFFEQLYPHDDLVTPILCQLRARTERGVTETAALEEMLYTLLERMLLRHRETYREIARTSPIRWSTKLEIYRRLHQARDYMEAYLDTPLNLPETARVACLSPYHFLRLFKQVFHETPHQYLTRRRLEHAQRLLRKTDMTITTISGEVGFESPSAFSRLFRNHLGTSPERFRAEQRDFGFK